MVRVLDQCHTGLVGSYGPRGQQFCHCKLLIQQYSLDWFLAESLEMTLGVLYSVSHIEAYICYNTVSTHNGYISVLSKEGSLPLCPSLLGCVLFIPFPAFSSSATAGQRLWRHARSHEGFPHLFLPCLLQMKLTGICRKWNTVACTL